MCLLFHAYEYRNHLCVCVCGGALAFLYMFFSFSFEIKGFQDSRLFPIFTLEFNR